MMRLFSVLLTATIYSSCFAQDTLALVDSKYKPDDTFIFLQGDSTAICFIHETGQTGFYESTNIWYYRKQKIAEIDLEILGKEELLGIQKYGDTVYYHGFSNKGKSATVLTARSIAFGPASIVAEHDIDGNVQGGYDRGGVITVVSLDRKANKVHALDVRRDKLVARNEIAFPWDIKQIVPKDVTFITPDHYDKIQLAAEAFKIFLQGNTLAIVFDDTYHDLVDPKDFRKTAIIRKDLVTGKQEADGFRIIERKSFISYLDGNLLYRVLPSGDDWKIVVQDLDANEAIYTLEFAHVDVTEFYRRSTAPVFLERFNYLVERSGEKELWQRYRNDLRRPHGLPEDIAIDVNNFGGEKVITVGFVNEVKWNLPFLAPPGARIAKRLLIGRTDAELLGYIYLVGSPKSKFQFAPVDLKIAMRMADDYELDQTTEPSYVEYTSTRNALVGIYAQRRSSQYAFVKFANRP